MPSLLGDRGTPQAPVRSRRAFAVSLVGHVALFVVVATVSLRTAVDLPPLHDPLAFVNTSPVVRLANMPAPARGGGSHREQPAVVTNDTPPTDTPPVPYTAPDGFDHPEHPSRGQGEPTGAGPGPFKGTDPGVAGPDAIGDGLGNRVLPPPPPATAAPKSPVRLHSGITAPVKTSHIAPVYPPLAQSARVQGTVILEAIISDAGLVESVRVLRSVALLDDAAIAAVRQWRYQPALVSGAPVPVIITVTVDFRLTP